jgi:hypothetical protein
LACRLGSVRGTGGGEQQSPGTASLLSAHVDLRVYRKCAQQLPGIGQAGRTQAVVEFREYDDYDD